MAPSRPVQLAATCVATLLGLAVSGAWAEEGQDAQPYAYSDLRIGYSSAPAPTVREKDKTTDNTITYHAGDARGSRVGVTLLMGCVQPDSILATVWGAQVSVGSYVIGDSGVTTNVTQPIVDFYYGWQYGIMETPTLRGWGELMPYVGAGSSFAKVDDLARAGYAVEGGVRFGAYLTERHWQLGLTSSYVLGQSVVKSDVHELTLNTNGFTFGGEFGYRF